MVFAESERLNLKRRHVSYSFLIANSIICILWSSFFNSGVSSSRPSGGRKSFPEAAHMSVSPSFLHLCSGQYSSRSPGRDQTKVRGGAQKGEGKKEITHSGRQSGPNFSLCCCYWSSRCAPHQKRRSQFRFFLTHEFQMCCCFLSMARGMWGMLEPRQSDMNVLYGEHT